MDGTTTKNETLIETLWDYAKPYFDEGETPLRKIVEEWYDGNTQAKHDSEKRMVALWVDRLRKKIADSSDTYLPWKDMSLTPQQVEFYKGANGRPFPMTVGCMTMRHVDAVLSLKRDNEEAVALARQKWETLAGLVEPLLSQNPGWLVRDAVAALAESRSSQ